MVYWIRKNQQYIITFILVVQVMSSAYAFYTDLKQPFSNAQKVAQFLDNKALKDLTVLGSYDYSAQAVSAFLGKKIYYPESDEFRTYIRYTRERKEFEHSNIGLQAMVKKGETFVNDTKKPIILILSHAGDRKPAQFDDKVFTNIGQSWNTKSGFKLKLINNFEGAIVIDENYYVFLLSRLD